MCMRNNGRPIYPTAPGYPGQPGSPGSHGLTWVPASNGHIPPGAVRVGTDVDGGRIHVCRATHEGDLLPGKLSHTKGGAFVSWSGREISKFQYEVLVANRVAWKYVNNPSDIPPEAIRAGHTAIGETLYVGRGLYQGVLNPGKIHPSHRCLYISWAGAEIPIREFEILIAY